MTVLATAFGVFFFQNWRTWDQNTQHQPVLKTPNDESDEDDFYEELDPMLKKKLLQTRRKSVSFSVCIVDKEKMTFALDRKHVLLGLASSTVTATSTCALPALEEISEVENTDDLPQHLPLVMPLPGERRMDGQAGGGGSQGMKQKEEKMYNSIETII